MTDLESEQTIVNVIDEAYRDVVEREATQPDNAEPIHIKGINPVHPEYETLREAGVDEADLESERIARGRLLQAGFVFLNTLGGGEKPVIATTLPASKTGPEVDFARRRLLTASELDRIRTHQQALRATQGVTGDLEEIRKEMLGFQIRAAAAYDGEHDKRSTLFREAQRHLYENGAEADRTAFLYFLADQTTPSKLGFIMDQCFVGVDMSFVGNVPVTLTASRLAALNGSPSPFIDSGFHFGMNLDITLYPNDQSRTRRLNAANIHLLSRGIDEMGKSSNGSHDQTYLTAAEYAGLPNRNSPPTDDIASHKANIGLVATRLLATVRDYTSR